MTLDRRITRGLFKVNWKYKEKLKEQISTIKTDSSVKLY